MTLVLSQTVRCVERLRAGQPGFGPNRTFQRPAVSGAHPDTYSRNGVTLPEVKAPGAWERPSHLHLVHAPSTWGGANAHAQLYTFLTIRLSRDGNCDFSNKSCSVDLSDLPAIKVPFGIGQLERGISSFSPNRDVDIRVIFFFRWSFLYICRAIPPLPTPHGGLTECQMFVFLAINFETNRTNGLTRRRR